MAVQSSLNLPAASWASSLASLPPSARKKVWASLSEQQRLQLAHTWEFWARREQLPPGGDWAVWLILTGRGWGKSRTGAEWIRHEVESGGRGRLALVARTAGDVRDVVVEGESGLLAIAPPWARPTWEPSKRRLTWPNGAIATTYTADEPDALRGPQHDGAWCDEVASWRYPEAWDNLMFGLRLGAMPRAVVTTTPRPVKLLKTLMDSPHTVVTRGRTYDNLANLAPTFRSQVIARYEGTRLGRQELDGDILEDSPGALWRRQEMIEAHRVRETPELIRVVVALDPSGTSGGSSDACGIVAAGLGKDGHGYVLSDRTEVMSPAAWGRLAVVLYEAHKADRIVAEGNFGGDMVEQTIRTVRDADDNPVGQNVPFRKLTASRGKAARAEPVSALYEQGKVHHVGAFPELEDELCSWEPNSGMRSPNRLDALVWALTDLMLSSTELSPGWLAIANKVIGSGRPA